MFRRLRSTPSFGWAASSRRRTDPRPLGRACGPRASTAPAGRHTRGVGALRTHWTVPQRLDRDPRIYGMEDVEAALGRGRRPFQGDPEVSEGSGLDIRHAALEALLDAGEAGRWRTLAHATAAGVTDVQRLAALAPHMSLVIDLVVRRLRAAQTIGVPTGLPPLLLLGPPGIGKTWLLARLAAALAVPFRAFAMNLATLGDSLTGSHPSTPRRTRSHGRPAAARARCEHASSRPASRRSCRPRSAPRGSIAGPTWRGPRAAAM